MPPESPLLGRWKYRSFYNTPEWTTHSDSTPGRRLVDVDEILFGEGELDFERADLTGLEGTGFFGEGYEVRFRGWCGFGAPFTVQFRGVGTGPLSMGWVYDYAAYLVPTWPQGVRQVPALVGSVIRSVDYVDHDGVPQPAGIVASFIAVRIEPGVA